MKKPFAISLGFHAAILLAALVVLPTPKAFEVKPPEAIQVDISAVISDKTQKTAQTKDPTPDTATPADKQTNITKDVPPAPKVDEKVNTASHEPTQPPPPKPDTKALDQMLKADEQKQKELQQQADEAQAIADAQKQADEKKKADDKKKAEELKKAEDKKKADEKKKLAQALADAQAQLNKIAGENTAPAKPNDKTGAPKHSDKNQQGADSADTATLAAALLSQVKKCFSIPAAAREGNVSVLIHFALNPDGSLSGQPEVQGGSDDPVFQATARAAISAIAECAPYQLPADQYDQWKDNVIDFNPTRLTG